ncbi:hypothetical protein [Nocardioides sp. LHG3406-4]|uniref:hypothetical protein n=1 Tax=Nocardioides sp. LHG3406-4 TaxID=2804575 RepID=UPI003CF8A41A
MAILLVAVGGVMLLMGGVWTAQGLGWLDGSPMTGQEIWAIIGPIVAGLGVALMIVGAQRRGRSGRR